MYTPEQLTAHKQEFDLLGEYLTQPLRLLTQKEAEEITDYYKDKYHLVINYWYTVSREGCLYLKEIASMNLNLLLKTLYNDRPLNV